MTHLENKLVCWMTQAQLVIPEALLQHYTALNLSTEEVVFLLHIKAQLDHGSAEPDMSRIATYMNVSRERIFQLVQSLTNKKLLSLQSQKSGDTVLMRYSLEPFYEKMAIIFDQSQPQAAPQPTARTVIDSFEKELGRALTPMELQTIGDWIEKDHYVPEIILRALKEAVLSQNYSLRYMDTILLSWQKKNLRTVAQIDADSRRFKAQRSSVAAQKSERTAVPEIPIIKFGDK